MSDDNSGGNWFEEHQTFVIVMVVIIAVVLLLGILLIVCMCRYPSWDFPEKLGQALGIDGDDECGKESSSPSSKSSRLSDAGSLRGAFTLPSSRSSAPLRLPTPGDAQPQNRLPPLKTVSGASSSRAESADSGAVLDDLKGRVGVVWNREVASDIPDVGGL